MPTLLRVTFWSAAIFAFLMAVVPESPDLPGVEGDKLNHMIAFFTLTLLGYYSYPRLPRARLMLALCAFGGVIELVQLVPALHRESTLTDWGTDILASLAALACTQMFDALRTGAEVEES